MTSHAPAPQDRPNRGAQVNDLLPLGHWLRHRSLRSWPVLLFLLLICVPSIALVALGPDVPSGEGDTVGTALGSGVAVREGWPAGVRRRVGRGVGVSLGVPGTTVGETVGDAGPGLSVFAAGSGRTSR